MHIHQRGKTLDTDQPRRTATPALHLHAAVRGSGSILRSPGQPLAAPLTEEMEDAARAAATEPGARAYTSGSHVVIGDGDADKDTLAPQPSIGNAAVSRMLAQARDQHGGAGKHILALQPSIGNAAVSWMLAQARHQHGAGCGHQQTAPAPVQRSAKVMAEVQSSPVPEVLSRAGRPLEADVRTDMEARLGADFSDVRVHTGAAAQRSAADLGACAFTSGSHVVIGHGGADRYTLAHELTHVLQQRMGAVAGTDRGDGLAVSDPSDRFERAAEVAAHRALAGPAPDPDARGAPGPARASSPPGSNIQLTRAEVTGGGHGYGTGNVTTGQAATGGVNHAEQRAWAQAENAVGAGIGRSDAGEYKVVFDVDTPVCEACCKWFEETLYPQLQQLPKAPGVTSVDLEVSVDGHVVQVQGDETIWTPEVADVHTFGRLGEVGKSHRLLQQGRDKEGRLIPAEPGESPYTPYATMQRDALAGLVAASRGVEAVQDAFDQARDDVATGKVGNAYCTPGANLAERRQELGLDSCTLFEGVTSGRLTLDGVLNLEGFKERVNSWLTTRVTEEAGLRQKPGFLFGGRAANEVVRSPENS